VKGRVSRQHALTEVDECLTAFVRIAMTIFSTLTKARIVMIVVCFMEMFTTYNVIVEDAPPVVDNLL
jgi:hypothetical protein